MAIRRSYEIELGVRRYEVEVYVDVREGQVLTLDVDRITGTSSTGIVDLTGAYAATKGPPAVLAELERLVDLDREAIEAECDEAAYDRSIDDRISARKEGF